MATVEEALAGMTGPGAKPSESAATKAKRPTVDAAIANMTAPGEKKALAEKSDGPVKDFGSWAKNSLNWAQENVVPGLEYVGKKLAAGALATGQGMAAPELAQGSMMLGGLTGQPGPTMEEMQFNPNEKVFGTPDPKAPDQVSDYLGHIAEVVGSDPAMAIATPFQVALGAVAGKAVGDWTGNPWLAAGASLFAGISAAGVGKTFNMVQDASRAVKTHAAAIAAQAAAEKELERANKTLAYMRNDKKAALPDLRNASKSVREAEIDGADQLLKDTHQTADANIQTVANTAGRTSSPQASGTVVQNEARSWLGEGGKFETGKATAQAPVDALVAEAPGMLVSRQPFADALTAITEKGGSNQELIELLKPRLPARMRDIFDPPAPGQPKPGQVRPGGKPIEPQPEPIITREQSWDDARALKSALGDAMADPQILKDIPQQQVAALYRAQAQSMEEALAANASRFSVDPVAVFRKANAELERLYDIAGGPIARLVSGKKPSLQFDPKPEAIAQSLINDAKAGGTDLAVFRQEIPKAMDELIAAHLKKHPEDWKEFSQEAKDALLPGVERQRAIDQAFEAKALATDNHAQAVAAAKRNHADRVREATEAEVAKITAKEREKIGIDSKVNQLQREAKEATAALPPPKDPFSLISFLHMAKSPAAAGALGYGASLLAPQLTSGNVLSGLGIAGASMAVPAAAKVVSRGVRPGPLARGVAGASNELNTPYDQANQ